MPQGGRPFKEKKPCPNCGGHNLYTIYWSGGFGVDKEPLETHCNQCGYAIDAQTGEKRNPGRVDLRKM